MAQAKKRDSGIEKQPDSPELKKIFKKAEEDFQRAQNELYRPSSDVETYSACFFSRKSLHHYLYYYYLKYNGPDKDKSPHELSLLHMAEYCSKFNDSIAKIDFREMNCCCADVLEEEKVFYCNDAEKVNSCKNISEKVREALFSEK